MMIKDELVEKLSRAGAMPFLFVGSGITRRYLGADAFVGLLKRFCKGLPHPFSYYYSKANAKCPATASLMVPDFHSLWYSAAAFDQSRAEYMENVGQTDLPLKIEISKHMLDDVSARAPVTAMLEEVELLKRAEVDGIITTNWDLFLDKLFPEFERFVGQDRLLFSTPQSIAEIYKIHGCCTDHSSLVLTNEDYRAFEKKNAYLAAKLLTVFVEHPIVFLGYSIDDENIKKILQSIAKCLSPERLRELSGRLFFVQWVNGLAEGTIELDTISKSLPLTIIKTDSFSPVYEALAATKRTIPAKTLRRLKEQVYHLVKTNDPKVKQFVSSLEALDSGKGPNAYLGVGPVRTSGIGKRGYGGLNVVDLIRDTLFDGDAEAEDVLQITLPIVLKTTKLAPIFKYLAHANRIDKEGRIITDGLSDKVSDRASWTTPGHYSPPGSTKAQISRLRAMVGGIMAVKMQYSEHDTWARLLPLLPIDQIDVDELRNLLRGEFNRFTDRRHITDFKRLVAFYDWLRFGPGPGILV
jgi:hypothetical protein